MWSQVVTHVGKHVRAGGGGGGGGGACGLEMLIYRADYLSTAQEKKSNPVSN